MSRYSNVPGKRNTLGTKDHVRIYERLKDVIESATDDGYCFYKPGFTDQIIARERETQKTEREDNKDALIYLTKGGGC